MVTTLVLILTVAGVTEYRVLHVEDTLTCDRWGKLSVASGEASAYRCYSSEMNSKKA